MAGWRSVRRGVMVVGLGLAVGPGAALGQVTLPLPPAKEPEPEFEPPPLRPPRPVVRPERTPRNANPNPSIPPPARATRPENLPAADYVPLARPVGSGEDYAGPVERHALNMHYAALTRNPFVVAEEAEKIRAFTVSRRLRLEPAVIENLETLLDIERGLLEGVTLENPQRSLEIGERIKPLAITPNPTQAMVTGRVISPNAAGLNFQIVREYQEAIGLELQELDPDGAVDGLLQQLMRRELDEPIAALRDLLYESTLRMGAVVEGLGLDGDTRERLVRAGGGEATDDVGVRVARAELVSLAWRSLSLDEKKQFLRNVVATREDPEQPPVTAVPLLVGG